MNTHKSTLTLLAAIFLGGCITQLQEVPTHYAAAPAEVAPPVKEAPPPPPPPAAKKEEAAPPPEAKSKVLQPADGKWTPAPKLNSGFKPEVTLSKIPAAEQESPPAATKEAPPAIKEEVPAAKPKEEVPAAKPKEAASPPPPPPPTGKVSYFVRLTTTVHRGEAEKLAWRAKNELELPVQEELLMMNGKKMYQVHAGPFTNQQQAQDVARRLKEQEKLDGEVFHVPLPVSR
ncbi:MAG: hypothetical protein G8345_14420 [Magnetococcales bacterium]|nr:SPOR domain-containing protein [Magnetococcales bacterium]NGZ28070.1 hypothetical protein [Magnetococcales bacterium]